MRLSAKNDLRFMARSPFLYGEEICDELGGVITKKGGFVKQFGICLRVGEACFFL